MKLAQFLLFTYAGIVFLPMFLGLSVEAAVTCQLDGVCKDSDKNGEGTVCSKCKSCTYKNCCNKVYTSEYAECKIKGWRADNYKGCADDNRCPDGYKCVAYEKGKPDGFCWKTPQGEGGNELFALAVAIAGLVILF